MKKILLFAIIVLLYIPYVYSQNEQQYFPSTGIRASYMGSVVYPGFKVGIERPYKLTQVDKIKKKGTKSLYKEHYFVYSFGMYHHPTFHDNFFLQAEWLMRRQRSKGMFYEFSPGLGLSRTFLDGPSFKIDESGKATKVPLAGNFYGFASLSSSIGYNFGMKSNIPLKVFLKPSVLVMFPYNKLVYPRPTVEIGAVYKLENFWKANPKYKHKVKDKTKKNSR
jgi:hypothetical protein